MIAAMTQFHGETRYKGPWIFAKIPSNAPMFAVMTRNFAKNSVNRASGYEGRKSRQMAPMFQL